MKQAFLFLILFCFGKTVFAQSIPTSGCEIVYTYDAAGNRTERAYYCNGNPTMFVTNTLKKDSLHNATGSHVEAMYPNPNDGKFVILFSAELKNADVFLRDMSGKSIQHFQISGTRIEFDISREAAGTYFVSIVMDNQILLTEKVIKAH